METINQRTTISSPRILELKNKRRKILKRKIIIFLSIFLFLFIGLVFLSRWERLQIENIEISGNKIIESKMILEKVEEDLTGHYLWVIPKTNFLLYPENSIKKELAEDFKRLENINVSIDTMRVLKIELSERKAVYTWCGDTLDSRTAGINTENKCYFMNELGYVFDEAPYFSGDVYFRFFGKINRNGEDPSGRYFLVDNFGKLIFFLDTLKNIDIKPIALYVKEDGEAELYLSSNASLIDSPKIIFNIDTDLNKIAENIQASVATPVFKEQIEKDPDSLLYLDLRFGNKIYYKFK